MILKYGIHDIAYKTILGTQYRLYMSLFSLILFLFIHIQTLMLPIQVWVEIVFYNLVVTYGLG